MKISKGLIKVIWFILCAILVMILGKNYELLGMSLIIVVGIIGFIIIEYMYKKNRRF